MHWGFALTASAMQPWSWFIWLCWLSCMDHWRTLYKEEDLGVMMRLLHGIQRMLCGDELWDRCFIYLLILYKWLFVTHRRIMWNESNLSYAFDSWPQTNEPAQELWAEHSRCTQRQFCALPKTHLIWDLNQQHFNHKPSFLTIRPARVNNRLKYV